MAASSNWAEMVGNVGSTQYERRIQFLQGKGINTSAIEKTVKATVDSFNYGDNQSFVVFGEPQSGKTEMMIALNARLLDEGCEVIINLLTDSVDLLQQNLSRFRSAGLSPSPKQFSELPSDPKTIEGKQWVVFSKKNARDLEKLKESLRFVKKLVIIDDEADYASPNAKINSGEKTRINELIHCLLEGRGQYIGVTATPARLDLNNTFDNNTERWVDFDPHPAYVGQDFFFPQDGIINYRLHQFEADEGDERRELQTAIFHFLCGVAEQHKLGLTENFTMLVHTSGKTIEHGEDYAVVEKTLGVLSDRKNPKLQNYADKMLSIAKGFDAENPMSLVEFVLNNIHRHHIVEINSTKKKTNISDVLTPKSLFSFGVGGNIISRGVTFDNLLSMYFTRSVKGKFTQDTYIQRARMFGNRSKYKNSFQLWIPKTLMENWTKCFAFHQLAIQAARTGMGAPVWLSDHKTTPTSPASIDRSSVDFEDGEMSFALFDYEERPYMGEHEQSDLQRLECIRNNFSEKCFPNYVYQYLKTQYQKEGNICFHEPSVFGSERSNYAPEEIESVRRKKGIFSTNEFRRGGRPDARHHLKIFRNEHGKARLFYKINGHTIRFIQNRR
jgi:hypothetical protein